MRTPLISVLVPCFNVENFVDKCLSSIRNQTYKNIEVICVNDGSTDNTLEILEKHRSLDDRIRIVSKKNSGYGHSMNIALSESKGDYVSIVESDDFIEADMLEKLLENAVKNDLDISKGCYFEYQEKNKLDEYIDLNFIPKNKILKPIDNPNVFRLPPSIWSAIYKKEFLTRNQILFLETPGASYQDTSFIFKCYLSADRFLMIPDAVLHYRVDNVNSSINNSKKTYCVCDEYEEIWRFAKASAERFDKVKTIIPLLQFSTYKWNYNRLKGRLRRDFLNRFRLDFMKINESGLINIELFSRHDRKVLSEILRKSFVIYFRNRL